MEKYKEWTTRDYPKPSELKAFGTFVCGGGSTMGYKLAGFQHLGGVEIDERMVRLYKHNHSPKYMYVEDIRKFNKRNDLPRELYNLDLLDGSPPCTTFSMAGVRERHWGKEKKFKEGQKTQRLDDLVYVYCDTIKKLRPKIAILENVAGIVAGRAKKYAIGIVERLNKMGYIVQIFKLNSATMGVPQARERVFFIARRKDLSLPPLQLHFNSPPISFGAIVSKNCNRSQVKPLYPSVQKRLPYVRKGERSLKYADARFRGLNTLNAFYGTQILYNNIVPNTLTATGCTVYYNEKRELSDSEYRRMSTFPKDYDFLDANVRYVCGMSVPPLMTLAITREIKKQWFNQ